MGTYYFDVLALHPHPEYLESKTGYILRLAQMFDDKLIRYMSQFLFPNTDRRSLRDIDDFPPVQSDYFIKSLFRTEEEILGTTFYYISDFFGKPTQPQAVSKFLSGSLSNVFRFCPDCLSSSPYYSLLWRFLDIKGCDKHLCYLIDCCPFCNRKIPIFPLSVSFLTCPSCGKSLQGYPSETIPIEKQEEIIKTSREYEFLLLPKILPFPREIRPELIGSILKQRRMQLGVNLTQKTPTGFKRRVAHSIELGEFQRGKISLCEYKQYCHFLGVDFLGSLPFKRVFGTVKGSTSTVL